jgi:hypothetical protein
MAENAQSADGAPIELWRAGIVALADWAAGGIVGRSKIDPVYVEVTENEHGCPRARYSSCADLVHWLAKRLGIQRPWVNRTDDEFGENWRFAVNVSRIAAVSATVGAYTELLPGDCCISWNRPDTSDAHVWVYLGPNPNVPGEHLSANYGAGGMSAAISPGSRVASKPLRRDAQGWIYGTRRVQRVLTVPALVAMRSGKRADFSGPLWSASFTGEVRDRLEATP